MPREDREIIEKVQAGDTEAFGELVEKYQKLVYNICLKMLKDPQDAEDAAQEAFIKAFRSIGSFRGESKFSVWLYRLTNNVCLDMLRRKKDNTVSLYRENDEGEEYELIPADESLDPAEVLSRRETGEELQKAIYELGEDYRRVLVMREIAGLSYEEIAQALQIDMGTVKSRIFRARKNLCRILLKNGNISGAAASHKKKGGASDE